MTKGDISEVRRSNGTGDEARREVRDNGQRKLLKWS